jgi:hypothetical protein
MAELAMSIVRLRALGRVGMVDREGSRWPRFADPQNPGIVGASHADVTIHEADAVDINGLLVRNAVKWQRRRREQPLILIVDTAPVLVGLRGEPLIRDWAIRKATS